MADLTTNEEDVENEQPLLHTYSSNQMMESFSDTISDVLKQFLGPCCGQVFIINGNQYRVLKVIGEGGFSFVYLVKSRSTGDVYAVKRIFAQNAEQVQNVRWEIQVHNSFKHANLLRLMDFSLTDKGNGVVEALLLFPAYTNGSLLDLLQDPTRESRMQTSDLLSMFYQICTAVQQMHMHEPKWAHRDIKPANVLLGDNNLPVLMDFGSAAEARLEIDSRSKGLELQEHAAENSSMPYRACELWDPTTGTQITEKTDVWSLGCLLFAMLYGKGYSPFECTMNAMGQPIAADCSFLRVIGKIPFPDVSRHPQLLQQLIEDILVQDPIERMTMATLMERVAQAKKSVEDVNVIVQH